MATHDAMHGLPAAWRTRLRTDPSEAHEIWQAKREAALDQFLSGQITRTVLGGALYGLGYRGSELSAELTFYTELKARTEQRKRDEHAAFLRGLRDDGLEPQHLKDHV